MNNEIKFYLDKEGMGINSSVIAPEFRANPELLIPKRATDGSAGYDIINPYNSSIEIYEDTITILDTFLKIKLPKDYFVELRLRSSSAIKRGIIIPNSSHVIDADYFDTGCSIKLPLTVASAIYVHKAGERRVIMDDKKHVHNPRNKNSVIIRKGEKIAQLVIMKYFTTDDDYVTETRTGGIGSTGKNI